MNIDHDRINQMVDFFALQSKTFNVYIFGAGLLGSVVGSFFEKYGISYVGYIDNAYEELNERYKEENEKKIYGMHEINEAEDLFVVVAAITPKNCEIIHNQLREFGVPEERIYLIVETPILFDIISDICTYIKYSQYTKRLVPFHNKYVGKRAFVIGNGPSLVLDDLNKLKEEYCFACNGIMAAFNKTEWRPSFYFASDPIAVNTRFYEAQAILSMIEQTREHFFATNIFQRKMFCYRNNLNLQGLYFTCENKVRYKYQQLNCKDGEAGGNSAREEIFASDDCYFSDDCSKLVYTFGTIVYNMLQMAVYMGFKEIYLLGVDNSYASSGYKDNTKDYSDLLNDGKTVIGGDFVRGDIFDVKTDLMTLGYCCARKYADEHGIKIYNATRGGKLEVFDRVNFDKLFANDKYNEIYS